MKPSHSALFKFILIAYAFTQSLVALAEPAHWPTFRGGFQNTGSSKMDIRTVPANAKVSVPTWYSSKGIVWGSPVIDDEGNAYVGSADKHFYKFSPEGKLLWSYELFDRADSLVDSAAALTQTGKVIVPGGDGYLHALDQKTGQQIWTFKAHGVSDADHAVGAIVNSFEGNVQIGPNGWIYAGSDNSYMYAIDDSGHEQWNYKTGLMIWSSPCFDSENRWMAFGSLDGHLHLLDPKTGAKLADWNAGSEIKSSPATDGKGQLYVGTSSGDFLKLSVTNSNGEYHLKKIWNYKAGGEIYSSPALNGKEVFFGSLEGVFYAVDAEYGNLLWRYTTHSPLASSPVVTDDGAVLFGAKNGKMYALDATSGERLWSVLLEKNTVKSNLDSSPAISPSGVLVNGSYSGNIYFLPTTFCLLSPQGCETKGHEDFPHTDVTPAANDGFVQIVEQDGSFHSKKAEPVSTFETIQIKLFAYEEGHLIDRASVSSWGDNIEITPAIPIETHISSDGGTINVRAITGFQSGVTYKIKVTGKYFTSTSWLADRFKWFGLNKFGGEVDFSTAPAQKVNITEARKLWGIQSLYLVQPKALDTYIPAALDGQGFLASRIGFDSASGKFILLVHPALPSSDGVPKPVVESSNAFLLTGQQTGHAFKAEGSMTISAMGGTIPFKKAAFSGVLDENDNFTSGEFFTQSSCLDIKGNGDDYSFPMGLISQVCDSRLRLICLGQFKGRSLPIAKVSALEIKIQDIRFSIDKKVEIDFTADSKLTAPHLISIVRYNKKEVQPTGLAFATVQSTQKIYLDMKPTEFAQREADVYEVFIDQTPVLSGSIQKP